MRRIMLVFAMSICALTAAGPAEAQEQRIRVYVAESAATAFSAQAADGFATATGGSNDQTVEIMKNLQEKKECRGLRATRRLNRANFVIAMDRNEGGFSKRAFGVMAKDNKIVVFDAWEDQIYANSTRSVGNAVKDACNAIKREIESGIELLTIGDTIGQ